MIMSYSTDDGTSRGRERDNPLITFTKRLFGERASFSAYTFFIIVLLLLGSIGSSPKQINLSSPPISSITSIQAINDLNITNASIPDNNFSNSLEKTNISVIANNLININETNFNPDNTTITINDDKSSKSSIGNMRQSHHLAFLSVYVYIFMVLFFLYAIIIIAVRLRLRSNTPFTRRDDNTRRMQMMLHLLRSRGGMTAAISGLRDLPAIVRLAMTTRDFNGDDYELLSQLDDPAINGRRGGITETQLNRFPVHTVTFTEINNMNYDSNDNNSTTVRRTSSRNNITDNNSNSNSDKRNCSICLAPYEVGDNIRTIPCLHYFHQDCIDPWLKSNSSCPVCKYSCLENHSNEDL